MTARSTCHRFRSRVSHRGGFTLLELTISVGAATFLIVGLASVLFISSRAMVDDDSNSVSQSRAGAALDEVTSDMRTATGFTERTATAVTFTVPDRDGDEQEETIRYSWSGTAGDSLMMEYNGGTAVVVADGIQSLDLGYLTRSVTGTGFAKGAIYGVTHEQFTEVKSGGSDVESIALTKPPGTAEGDLLVAVVVIGDDEQTVAPPSGWSEVSDHSDGGELIMGVWWKIANASEPTNHVFSWEDEGPVYGWMMRFTGHHPTAPIHAHAKQQGESKYPPAPAVVTTVDGALILRLGGFSENAVTLDSPGLSGHETITADGSGDDVSGAAGYMTQSTAGIVGAETFALTEEQKFITLTIAIAPAP